jgi:hypothetical protein
MSLVKWTNIGVDLPKTDSETNDHVIIIPGYTFIACYLGDETIETDKWANSSDRASGGARWNAEIHATENMVTADNLAGSYGILGRYCGLKTSKKSRAAVFRHLCP